MATRMRTAKLEINRRRRAWRRWARLGRRGRSENKSSPCRESCRISGESKRAAPSGGALDSLLALAFLFGLSQLRGFLDLALQFFHLATQLFLLFRELVLVSPRSENR